VSNAEEREEEKEKGKNNLSVDVGREEYWENRREERENFFRVNKVSQNEKKRKGVQQQKPEGTG
jgi:hypothetical protein